MFFSKRGKKREPKLPELYTEEEIKVLEAHICKHFGEFANVLHEIVSPDIHVDIAVIEPSEERNFYTMITMGMGAHRMNVPGELASHRLERAEAVICLPPDWDISAQDEKWYWPLRWLKILARLPIEHSTWLGWGHTVPNGEPFAENTNLCCMLLLSSDMEFGESSSSCEMPDGSRVVFYQMIPLYEDEMQFKIENNAEALLEQMPDSASVVVDIDRPSAFIS